MSDFARLKHYKNSVCLCENSLRYNKSAKLFSLLIPINSYMYNFFVNVLLEKFSYSLPNLQSTQLTQKICGIHFKKHIIFWHTRQKVPFDFYSTIDKGIIEWYNFAKRFFFFVLPKKGPFLLMEWRSMRKIFFYGE